MAKAEVLGLERLLNAFNRVQADAEDQQVFKLMAEEVLFGARQRVPYVSGALQRSGRTSSTKRAGFVRFGSSAVPYAGPAHFGHRPRPQGGYMLPNPFLYDAADARADAVRIKFLEHFLKIAELQGLSVES